MSTSLLYHAFGVRGYRYRKTDYIEGSVVFTIERVCSQNVAIPGTPKTAFFTGFGVCLRNAMPAFNFRMCDSTVLPYR